MYCLYVKCVHRYADSEIWARQKFAGLGPVKFHHIRPLPLTACKVADQLPPQPLQSFNPRVFLFNLEHNEILSRSLNLKGRFPICRLSPVRQKHSSFLFWTQSCVLNLDWATRDLGKWKQQGPVKPAHWHEISVQIPVIPSVKGLHYARRI